MWPTFHGLFTSSSFLMPCSERWAFPTRLSRIVLNWYQSWVCMLVTITLLRFQRDGTGMEHVHDGGDDEAIIVWTYDVLNGRNEVVQCRGDGGRCCQRSMRDDCCVSMVNDGGHGFSPLSVSSGSLLTPPGVRTP
jgi:hypothetical protein